MSSTLLPAEGLTLEALVRPFRATLLQPLVTGSLLLGSLRAPSAYQHLLTRLMKDQLSLRSLKQVLAGLLAAGILYRLNNLLTKLALNNWVSDKSWDWQREIVLVTGGCSGIGELIVRKLAERKIRTVVFDVSDPRVPGSPTTSYYKVDITSSAAIHEAATKLREEVGHPTILVNNAGIGVTKTIFDATEESIRGTFSVNVIAHFLLVREFVPHMARTNHGHIVTIASMASFLVHAGNVAYASTKAAALAFHEGLGQELKSGYGARKVRTTVVHPSWVRTPLIKGTLLQRKDFNEFVLDPTTVADAVAWYDLFSPGLAKLAAGRTAKLGCEYIVGGPKA